MRLFLIISLLGLCMILVLAIANYRVVQRAQGKIFSSLEQIPDHKVALVLGTSKLLASGNENPYFIYRIHAASALYHANKVQFLVVSGDNRRDDYNEPEDMKAALVTAGVPTEHIFLDYAGLRTLDSIIRMHKIFGQEQFIIVSQHFHNERAIVIAEYHGLKAVGFDAQDLSLTLGLKTQIREKFARLLMWFDLLLNRQPKHLGAPVNIP